MWVDFRQRPKKVVDMYIPLKTEGKRVRNRLSNHVQRKIRERCRAWQKYRQYQSGRNFAKYKQLRNEVNRAIRKEEDQKRKRILAGFKNNPKRFHGYMHSKQTVKDNVMTLRKYDRELTRIDQETADLLAAYFKEVYTVKDVITLPVVIEKDLGRQDSDLNFDQNSSNGKTPETQLRQITRFRWYPLTIAQRMCNCSSRANIITFSAVI